MRLTRSSICTPRVDEVLGIMKIGALGTRGYMALELEHGARPTPACDQYSLAVLAFELLTGELPFDNDDDIRDMPKPMAVLAPKTSAAVREMIERALVPDSEARFPSVLAFVRANERSTEAFERSTAISDSVMKVAQTQNWSRVSPIMV